MPAPARVAAYHVLCLVDDGDTDLPTALARARERLTDPRDRALTSDIVYGTLRWRRALDHLIAQATTTGHLPDDARVLTVLRLSLYQLWHLDRVPAAAVVDDAVDMVRMAQRRPLAGFVNAVLRTVLRRRRQLVLPPGPPFADRAATLAYLGVTQSHPEWLVTRWLDRLGQDAADAWVRFDNAPPPVTLRANTIRNTREALQAWLANREVETSPTRWAPHGLIVTRVPDGGLPVDEPDRFLIQDEASQLVAALVDARPGHRVLDLCAAPGGKTTALAGDMRQRGVLVACDVRPRRLRLLAATLAHAGTSGVHVVQVDRVGALPFSGTFDRVLVDAPCSGLGTLRRDPDIRWRRSEAALAGFAAIQQGLLARAAACVAPGGLLVYATCSSEPDENDAVVAAFLDQHPQFAPDRRERDLPETLRPLVDTNGVLRPTPHEHGLEPFFAAPLVRRG